VPASESELDEKRVAPGASGSATAREPSAGVSAAAGSACWAEADTAAERRRTAKAVRREWNLGLIRISCGLHAMLNDDTSCFCSAKGRCTGCMK
jgi:hypothetical protein